MSDTIVTMRFRLLPGHTRADWLAANEKVNAWILRQPGFEFRSLSETGDGEWMIIGYWTSAEAADKAEEEFTRENLGSVVFPFVDMDSFNLTRSTAHVMLPASAATQAA